MSIGPCDSLLFWFYFCFILFRFVLCAHFVCVCVYVRVNAINTSHPPQKNPGQSTHNCVFYAISCRLKFTYLHNYSRIIRFPHTMWTTVRINDRRINDRPKQANLVQNTDTIAAAAATATYNCSVSVAVTINILWK